MIFSLSSSEKIGSSGFSGAKRGDICKNRITEKKKSCYCSLALEEILFNILEYQKANDENNPNIDVHIVLFGDNKMIMRVKDCSKERDPFAKYEYRKELDSLENIGIKIVKSFAADVKYSFIYGVNFRLYSMCRKRDTILCIWPQRSRVSLNCSRTVS